MGSSAEGFAGAIWAVKAVAGVLQTFACSVVFCSRLPAPACPLPLPRPAPAPRLLPCYNRRMAVSGRRKSIAFFITLGACLVALAIALNVGWILLNAREVALLVFGIIFFLLIITGLVLNTTFLIREIRRNEQHDAFINAVTHELKTPLASIRLYLETLKKRDIDENKRQEFYDVMLADSDRLLQTVEQVLRAGQSGQRRRKINLKKDRCWRAGA